MVKAFNDIFYRHLATLGRPSGDPERGALAGDDEGAKRTVTTLLDELGYDTVDAGPLSEGRRFQPDTPADGLNSGSGATYPPGEGHAVSATDLAAALAQAD